MHTQPPIVVAAEKYGIDSFRELIDKGLYNVAVPPKHTVEEIKDLLQRSAKDTESEALSANQ